jgi:hypothetical protein
MKIIVWNLWGDKYTTVRHYRATKTLCDAEQEHIDIAIIGSLGEDLRL